jgi:hypothetical protein
VSDWEERKPKPVLIPTDLGDFHLHYPAGRAIRHQTLLCCVSASADAYCPLLVFSNQAAFSVFQIVVRESINLSIKIEASPYVTKEILLDYIRKVVIPAVESNRQLPECQGKQKWGWLNRGLFHQELHNLTRNRFAKVKLPSSMSGETRAAQTNA